MASDKNEKTKAYIETDEPKRIGHNVRFSAEGNGHNVRFSDPRLDGFKNRLKSAVGRDSVRGFARKSGVAETTLREYLKGKSFPGLEALTKIAVSSGVALGWLASGEGPKRAQEITPEPSKNVCAIIDLYRKLEIKKRGMPSDTKRNLFCRQWNQRSFEDFGEPEQSLIEDFPILDSDMIKQFEEQIRSYSSETRQAESRDKWDKTHEIRERHWEGAKSEFVTVRHYDLENVEGAGSVSQRESSTDRISFKRSWLQQKVGLNPDSLALLTVRGDSMEPTFHAADVVLVDLSQKEIRDDAIYVLRNDNQVIIKRVQRLFDGGLYIKSDNPAYHEQLLTKADLSKVEIVGRVVWFGRMI